MVVDSAYICNEQRNITAHSLTMDEARRIATNIAKLPSFLMAQLLND